MSSSSPVAFVLSGGGSLGAVQVGLAHATLIRRALVGARRFLDEGGADRPPNRMTMHRHDVDLASPAEVVVA